MDSFGHLAELGFLPLTAGTTDLFPVVVLKFRSHGRLPADLAGFGRFDLGLGRKRRRDFFYFKKLRERLFHDFPGFPQMELLEFSSFFRAGRAFPDPIEKPPVLPG